MSHLGGRGSDPGDRDPDGRGRGGLRQCGFTLVEVLVALVVVALGLAALMTAVSGVARTSGYLRDKTLAQWIALNRLAEVRLTVNRLAQDNDAGQLDFANRTWHYDTRYFDTTIPSMKRVVVRVWPGDAKTKGNPLAESTGFLGASVATPGSSNVDWTLGSTAASAMQPCQPGAPNGTSLGGGSPTPGTQQAGNCTPTPGTSPTIVQPTQPGTTPTPAPTPGNL
jgi:type II secretion system protein I